MNRVVNETQAPLNGVFIVTEGVRHVYKGGTVALDGVDLRIGTGLFGLLGPNGAGKSTLMRIICTLLVPTEGRVTVAGHDVVTERRAVRRLFGYLPQEFSAWRLHRVEEVLDTLASLSGMDNKAARRARVAEVLELVGLQEVAHRKVKKLSGGMVRRLGVAQALIHEPKVLVVDEPTVGLDPEERLHFRKVMAELGRERTIVLSTHIVADLGSGCTDLALIDNGKVEFRGSPAELVSQARGHVFELTVAKGKEAEATASVEVVFQNETRDGVKVRAVSGGSGLPEGAVPVDDPTLEEAYLAFMAARGRVAAAQEEEVA
jgi:ABC-type multidrug transport system ATPase subunit